MAVKKDAFSNMFFFGVSIVDKLEPIFKTKQGTDAARTCEYASNPKRKNTPCISDLAGAKFSLKKERVFFFRGSAFQVFGQCVGLQYGLGKTRIQSPKNNFCKKSACFFRSCFASMLRYIHPFNK